MTKALNANGARRVYIVGRRHKVLEPAAREAVSTRHIVTSLLKPHLTRPPSQRNGNITPYVANIQSKIDIQSVVARVESECSQLDVLINNACVFEVRHKAPLEPHPNKVETL